MPGTLKGGKKAAATNMLKHGKDFYKRIGAMGGRNGHTGGFAANPELAKIAGAKGGKISKRGKAKKHTEFEKEVDRLLNLSDEELKAIEFWVNDARKSAIKMMNKKDEE